MGEIWIADASPIILLAKAGYISLLEALAGEIWLPLQVCQEIERGPHTDPGRMLLSTGWGVRKSVPYIPAALRPYPALGSGEKAALALALKNPGCRVLVDDAAGRRAAKNLGILYIGVLGLVARAKNQGVISAASTYFEALKRAGAFISDDLIRETLTQLGEPIPEVIKR